MVVASRNPTTTAVATFVHGTTLADLPGPVVHAARRSLLDSIGCALGGVATPLHARLVQALDLEGGNGPATTVGGAFAGTAGSVALINAVSINALDYDDTYEDGTNPMSHPGSSTVGALLAMASTRPLLTLGDLVTATAVGYETVIRIARAVQPSQERRDMVWGLGPHQVFGSAAVAARLLSLDLDATIGCLGLAGVHTSVPSVWAAAGWLKDAVGWPAMTGVLAGHLAAAGFSAPTRILDGRRSYYATVASDRYRPELITEGLGGRWLMTEMSFKPYPACRWIHPVLDALVAMRDGAGVAAADVASVEIAGFWELEKLFLRYRPADLVDAQFSLPYTCAQVLLGTSPGPAWFTEAMLHDEEVATLAARVTVVTDPEVEARRKVDPSHLGATVTLKSTDGRRLQEFRAIGHGHPTEPMTDAELQVKFQVLATPILGSDRAGALASSIMGSDLGESAAPLMDAITGRRPT